MKTLTLLLTILFIMSGCSSRITPPTQLENSPQITINQGIIKNHHTSVPQDLYLKSQDWRASLSVTKGRYYLPNNKIIKTFYYAHHAYKIKLSGNAKIINKYKRYFQKNGVNATFCLHRVHQKNRYRVDMMFSHLKDDLENLGCGISSSKNIKKAKSPVIQI